AAHRLEDQRAIRLARARARRAAGWRRAWGRGVGGHLHRGGRIWRWPHGRPSAGAPHRDAGRPQIGARRLAADARCRFDAAQRPPEAAEREDLLPFGFAQDVAHERRRTITSPPTSTSRTGYRWWPVFRCPSVAGFGCPPRLRQTLPTEFGAAFQLAESFGL